MVPYVKYVINNYVGISTSYSNKKRIIMLYITIMLVAFGCKDGSSSADSIKTSQNSPDYLGIEKLPSENTYLNTIKIESPKTVVSKKAIRKQNVLLPTVTIALNFKNLEGIVNTDSISYDNTKLNVKQLRTRLISDLKNELITLETVKEEFTEHLVKKLIPYWYGTPWSFQGHTSTPNQGQIACGYFLSTTLRDMGLKLNRYKLAQKSPIDEAKVISCGAPINTITETDAQKAYEAVDNLTTNGIYFIGFDKNHVGYLLKEDNELFLVHSNYMMPVSVCIERLEDSKVFKNFSTFHIVAISNNKLLLKRWLNNEVIF